jgi:hypothetical protein
MKTRVLAGSLTATGLALGIGQFSATALPGGGDGELPSNGPDVIVGDIPDIARYAPASYLGKTFASYAVGTTSCNIGNQQLLWQPNPSNMHPTIPQNMYRVKNGALEQIGMSWCKHGFCALQQNICGTCTPAGGGCPTVLGIGCSDPYTASLNGAQNDLKSRGPINPSTGWFSGTYSDPPAPSGMPTSIRERLAVDRADLDPAQNAGAAYFVEGQYVHIQDSEAGNATNNSSYRRVNVGSNWSNTQGYPLTLTGATVRLLPAIYGWKDVHSDVTIVAADATRDGRFNVGYRTWENADGTWHYEYAIHNLNSDRAGGSFSVPIPEGVSVTNVGFKSPMYMNGEGYSNAPWTARVENGFITWTCEPNTNPNANALRWSTTYNFRFDANAAPVNRTASLGLWKAPPSGVTETALAVAVKGPDGNAQPPCPTGDFNCDQVIDGIDLGHFLSRWGTEGGDTDFNGDNYTDGIDLGMFLGYWTF